MAKAQQAQREEGDVIRVLVAEDDDGMRELIGRVLGEEGYRVIPARDGTEAVRLLEEGGFDLVLTDVRMPGHDGTEVLRRAMARRLHQPVILMTAFGSIESAVAAMRDGAYHYLAKPFDIDDLLEIIAGAARRIRQVRALQAAAPAGSSQCVSVASEVIDSPSAGGYIRRMESEVLSLQLRCGESAP